MPSLDVTRGVGDCAVTGRAGAGSLQSVIHRGNTDSTSSSQLLHSHQGFRKNPYSTCDTLLWSTAWSLASGAHCWRGIPTVCKHNSLWNKQQIHTETVLCTLLTALLETIPKQPRCFFPITSSKRLHLIALSPFIKCKALASQGVSIQFTKYTLGNSCFR